ncbi:hypothetical protein AVEN_170121-1, partial [Araneus ventricosus]
METNLVSTHAGDIHGHLGEVTDLRLDPSMQ